MHSELKELIDAAFSGILLQTLQPDAAEEEIRALATREGWDLLVWDLERGTRHASIPANTHAGDPLGAIRALSSLGKPGGTTVLVMHHLHRFWQSADIQQALLLALNHGKGTRHFIVALSPVVNLPVELERQFLILDHPLPDAVQLAELARSLLTEGEEIPEERLQKVVAAAGGLTLAEAENAFALSLTRTGHLDPATVFQVKAQQLRKSGLLSLHRGSESFDQLGGLSCLKHFCLQALRPGPVRPKGVLLLGPPGTGKSAFAKSLGRETNRPVLELDIGALYGSLVGQTEANIRTALRVAEAMAPCVLLVDEIEKALSGIGGNGDSGTATRLFGTLLTWLNDHQSQVFVVCTANDVSKLPPEFTRAGRFDATFYLDFPTISDRERIWEICLRQHDIQPQPRPDDHQWTGSEIASCCRLSVLLGLPLVEAGKLILPVANTAREKLEALAQWASGRTLSASLPGPQGGAAPVPTPPRRMRNARPGLN